jgi:hypothetical protein
MYIVYGFLAVIVIGFVSVLCMIGPVLAEAWTLMIAPIGSGMQWIACRIQVIAIRLWDAGSKMEREGKLIRRIS